jgi:hypothetical protein
MTASSGSPHGRDALAEEVRSRVPQPIDVLEIAAVVESMGITDAVASEDYAAEDAFELADHVFEVVRARSVDPSQVGDEADYSHLPLEREEPSALLDKSARGLLALAPLALLVIGLEALTAAGWSTGSILALSFGVTAAMLLTSGPIVAIGRRTSIYLGFDQRESARRFVTRSSLLTLIACSTIGLAAFGAASVLGLFGLEQRAIFTASLAGYALLWLLSAGLALVTASRYVVGILVGGVALGIVTGVALGATVGIAVGYGATVVVLAAAWGVAYPRGNDRSFISPRRGALLLDASPYLAFGSAFALFLVLPHFLGWFGEGDATALDRLTTLELSLLLALLPVLLGTGVSERILRSFWDLARESRDEDGADGFRRGVREHVVNGLVRYGLVLGALSVVTAAGFELMVALGELDDASQLVFACGLAGFFLLGLGQFSCLFMLGLALPNHALKPLLVGLVVLVGLGIPLSLVDFRLAALSFAVGAAALALTAVAGCLSVLVEIPRRYSTAF